MIFTSLKRITCVQYDPLIFCVKTDPNMLTIPDYIQVKVHIKIELLSDRTPPRGLMVSEIVSLSITND